MARSSWSAWHDHFDYKRGPMGAVITCNYCKHAEQLPGSKLWFGDVTNAKSRMIEHIKEKHPSKTI